MRKKDRQSHAQKRKSKLAKRACRAKPKFSAVRVQDYLNGAIRHHRAGRLAQAERIYQQILQAQPNHPEALHLLGVAAQQVGNNHIAIDLISKAIAVNDSEAQYHYNLGCTLKDQGKMQQAIVCYERALEIRPDYAPAHENLGSALLEQGRFNDGTDSFKRAMSLKPDDGLKIRFALATPVIFESVDEMHQQRRRIRKSIARLMTEDLCVDDPVRNSVGTFFLVYQGMNERDLMSSYAELYSQVTPSLRYVAPHCLPHVEGPQSQQPIKIGFISKYFYNHPIGRSHGRIVEKLSRDDFRVVLFRFPGPEDEVAHSIEQAADKVVTLPLNLDSARQQIAAQELDVLFYTDIGLDPWTYCLAFARLAPVQCVTAGHPVTTGIPTLDYFVSAEELEPEDADEHYSEQLVRLRNVITCFHRPQVPSPPKSRKQFGFDENTHLYFCPHALFMIHPEFDHILGGILRSDPKGRIILFNGQQHHWTELLVNRLRRSIPNEVDRVRFLPWGSSDDFLHLLGIADVVLDTTHFNVDMTSLAALGIGAPIVTLPGQFMRGRYTYACYRKMGVLDCVAANPGQYVQIALRLANDPAWRIQIRGKILLASRVLFENINGVRELEQFLQHAVGALRRNPTVRIDLPRNVGQGEADSMSTIPEALAVAVKHHQAGRVIQAGQIYREILRVDPKHPEVLNLVGVMSHQVGRHEQAIDYIKRAIALKPHKSVFHENLSSAYLAMGKFEEASASCERALQIYRDYEEASAAPGRQPTNRANRSPENSPRR